MQLKIQFLKTWMFSKIKQLEKFLKIYIFTYFSFCFPQLDIYKNLTFPACRNPAMETIESLKRTNKTTNKKKTTIGRLCKKNSAV